MVSALRRGLEGAAGFLSATVVSELLRVVFILLPMSGVTNFTHAPSFDGEASSSANNEQVAPPRNRISTLGPATRSASLLLNMADVARKVCMTVS